MKTKIKLLVFAVLLTSAVFAQPEQSRRDIKAVVKEYRKQGFKPDPTLGSLKYQVEKIEYYSNLMKEDSKDFIYWVESIEAESKSKEISQDKARDLVRAQYGKNIRNLFDGAIEHGLAYYTGSGEDISDELRQAEGAFDDIFKEEISRNKIVARFFKKEKGSNGLWRCLIVCALNESEFERDVKSLTKKDIQKRIEAVRERNKNRKTDDD